MREFVPVKGRQIRKEVLKWIAEELRKEYYLGESDDQLIDLRKEEENGKSEECKEEYKNPEGDK